MDTKNATTNTTQNMSWLERCLRWLFAHKEIGWEEIGERFTRFQLLKTPWFNIYLHKLDAPRWHPQCHDHPWSFATIILKGGYMEATSDGTFWRRPGTVLFRRAEFSHNVITVGGPMWSLVFTGPKRNEWGFHDCHGKGREDVHG